MTHTNHFFFNRITLLLLLTVSAPALCIEKPHATIVFVIDQFAYHYLYKLKPFLTGGIRFLLDNGVVYENAHHPHAMPETAVGHTALNTGVLPKDHGIIANSWFDVSGKEIAPDDDDATTAAVFKSETEMHNYGKGPKLIMVDGLSDQFVLQSQPNTPHVAFSLSIKSRAAITTATKLGKAIWFDNETGLFTSSKAYFNQLPSWVVEFNKRKKVNELTTTQWNLMYEQNSKYYDFAQTHNYAYAAHNESVIGKTRTINHDPSNKDPFTSVYKSPMGNDLLLELAQDCIDKNLTKNNELLLWISLSSLDLIAHQYGPDSLEAIDMVYHVDAALKKFIQYAQKKIGKNKVLFVLTADHGVVPMQGILKEKGIKTAYKLSVQDLIKEMNEVVLKKHQIGSLVTHFQMPHFYFDGKLLKELNTAAMADITKELKAFLMLKDGVKNVWTYSELDMLPFDPVHQELENNFKMQRYPGRSGQLFVQLQPYALLTKYTTGTSHESPYNYDTHVPLVIYKKGEIEKKKVVQKVYSTQLANTLAQITNVQKPSASTAQVLPGIYELCPQEQEKEDAAKKHSEQTETIEKQQAEIEHK
ncbi:MAG: alkaline phosphatase family protein [Candidatus Dependentiae bacterium]|nr:alkaline phosphatase family protein [Candidatus Dependentiae bacterium]